MGMVRRVMGGSVVDRDDGLKVEPQVRAVSQDWYTTRLARRDGDMGAPCMNNRRAYATLWMTIITALLLPHGTANSSRADGTASSTLSTYDLRCEMRQEPLGIDAARPRLSWKLSSNERGQRQSAYQVLVSDSRDSLIPGAATYWDTGKVETKQSLHIVYGGRVLRSRERCYWTVRVWDHDGVASAWSEPATWEMGLLDAADWQAQWIDDGKPTPASDEAHYAPDPAPLLRTEFAVRDDVARARLYISGLGYYDATINGEPVGKRVLDPIWTQYGKRVFYSTYDVTQHLQRGDNAIGVMLGNGWYNPLPLRMWGNLNLRDHLVIGRPRLIAQLEIEYASGQREVIATDKSWKTSPGPIVRNNIYLGEQYDARREQSGWNRAGFDDTTWASVHASAAEIGPLQATPMQPIRVIGHLRPVAITEPQPGVFIVDLGQNFTGWARLSVEGTRGTQVRMRFGELLHDDGTLNPMTSVCGQIKREGVGGPGAPAVAVQQDTYTLRGGEREMYTPRFTFHAFRYVEITGYPGVPSLDAIEGLQLASDLSHTGHFSCSSDLLNRIHKMVRWTFLSNLVGVQSDCPHRERFGYGGDIVATCEAFMMHLDMSSFYAKTVMDLADSASPTAAFPMTAPYVGIAYAGLEEGDGPIGWSLAHPLLVRELYRHYGDRRIVEQQYEAARRWVEYVRKRSVDDIVEQGLSDHESLEPKAVRVTSTAFYLQGVEIVSELATILGRDEDARRYRELAGDVRRAFAESLVNADSGRIGIGTQAAQAAAMYHNLVPDHLRAAAFARLVEPIETDPNHLVSGIFGVRYLLDVLSREGRADLAHALVDRTSAPGWGHMLERGATTLWEHWAFSDNTFSHNHPMFGSVSTWMFSWLAGIAPAADTVGFDRVLFRPQLVPGLTWASARYESARGPIESRWMIEDGQFTLRVALPPGVIGDVQLPASCAEASVMESTIPVDEARGVTRIGPRRLRVESGEYKFSAPIAGD